MLLLGLIPTFKLLSNQLFFLPPKIVEMIFKWEKYFCESN